MKDVSEDLLPARETRIQIAPDIAETSQEVFAICLETDDADLLVPLKTYRIALRGEYVRVVDEKGEPAIYPREFFLPLDLTREAVSTLTKAYAAV